MYTVVNHNGQKFVIAEAVKNPTPDYKGDELAYYHEHALAGFMHEKYTLTGFMCGADSLQLTICRQYTDAQLITLAQAMQQIEAIGA